MSAFIGTEVRATTDMDTIVKGLPVTAKYIARIICEICNVKADDNVTFKIAGVSEIMDEAEYSGLRFAMEAYLDGSVIPLKIDASTGDAITPRETLYSYKLMFEDRSISIMTYPIETVWQKSLKP